jgi:uncharacterized protein (DUF433 family)
MARETKVPFNARLNKATLKRLRDRAANVGANQTALAERYIDEGVRMDEHPLIHFRDGAAGRRPALIGTRLDVAQVIETIRQNGNSPAEAAAYLELPQQHVEACIAYYLAYQDEVDDWIERERRAADEAEVAWRRRQQSFA